LVVLIVKWLSWLQPIGDGGWGRFTLEVETLIAQGNKRDSYPDHLTTLNYPAYWLTFLRKLPVSIKA